MEEQIKSYVDGIFANVENTQNVRELKEELCANLIERYHDLLNKGESKEDAYRTVTQSAGNASDYGFCPKYYGNGGASARDSFGMRILRDCTVRDAVESVNLEWHIGEAQILISPSEEIRIVQKADRLMEESCLFTFWVSGGTLYVVDNNRGIRRGLFGRWTNPEKSCLELYLPRRMYQMVRLHNSSGSTRAQYLEAKQLLVNNMSGSMVVSGNFSNINVKNNSGSSAVESRTPAVLEAVNSSGKTVLSGALLDMDVRNSSGSVDVRSSGQGKLRLHCNSGVARAEGSFKTAEVRVSSGKLDLETAKMPEYLNADVNSGIMTIRLPEEKEGFRMQITKGSGMVQSDFSTLCGEGKYEYKVRVSSGMLRLHRR